MIRIRKLQASDKYTVKKIELGVIFDVSRRDNTVNQMKPRRLADITHFICPFVASHYCTSVPNIINHVFSCYKRSSDSLEGREALKTSEKWTICSFDANHMYIKDFESIHFEIQGCKSRTLKWQ